MDGDDGDFQSVHLVLKGEEGDGGCLHAALEISRDADMVGFIQISCKRRAHAEREPV